LIRWLALGLGAAGLITYAVLRIDEGRPVLPNIVGAALGILVLGLLARRR
jgi:MYXO-CTERM domain-containing protein